MDFAKLSNRLTSFNLTNKSGLDWQYLSTVVQSTHASFAQSDRDITRKATD